MTVVEERIDICAPIDQVFAALTDPRRAPEWNPNIVEVENVSGALGEGATWDQTMMMMGRPVRLRCRVGRYEPPTQGVIEISGGQKGRVWTLCEPLSGGTRVIQGIEFEPPSGLFGRMVSGAIAPMLRRELGETLQRQKVTLEAHSHESGSA